MNSLNDQNERNIVTQHSLYIGDTLGYPLYTNQAKLHCDRIHRHNRQPTGTQNFLIFPHSVIFPSFTFSLKLMQAQILCKIFLCEPIVVWPPKYMFLPTQALSRALIINQRNVVTTTIVLIGDDGRITLLVQLVYYQNTSTLQEE